LFELLQASSAARCAVGLADVYEIDALNILQATYLAMARALAGLNHKVDIALVDGNRAPPLGCAVQTVIKGDSLSLSIAAASILAKVTRDRMMTELAAQHPGYGWDTNMGYGTPEHGAALKRLGVTAHHRRTFAPVRAVLRHGVVR
jgi:ribonuclease HII